MNNTQRKWVNDNLDQKSKSFCAAKWYNATVWLGNGMTASCHHPPPHQITVDEVTANPSALHNTTYKKLIRREMQNGVFSKECEYCWKIEGIEESTVVSDRYYKSVLYDTHELQAAFDLNWQDNAQLSRLEISFDSNCNMACSYCNAGYSTKWSNDIKKHGAYQNLVSDGWGAFAHDGSWAMPYGIKNNGNPYLDAFWKWWESDLHNSLKQIRVTGGEATMSNDFWKLVEWFECHPDADLELSLNTNLKVPRDKLARLCELSKIHKVSIFTSNESVGENAEYIRDGMEWDEWSNNMDFLFENGSFTNVNIMMTINALCLASIDRFHEYVIDLRARHQSHCHLSYNILRFPSFQSITTLPKEIREEQYNRLSTWLENQPNMMTSDIEGMHRVLDYIKYIDEGHSVHEYSDLDKRQHDFVNFFSQYDARRNKDFNRSFVNWPSLVEWMSSVDTTKFIRIVDGLVDGNAVDWGKPIYDSVMSTAMRDGIV